MKLNLKSKTIISVAVFLAVFVALILIATYCDLAISKILTKNILDKGDYFANDFFGVLLESVGCLPIYLMGAFLLCVLFWSSLKLWNKRPVNIICAVILGVGVVAAFWIGLKDSIGYMFEHALARTGNISGYYDAFYKFEHSAAVYGIEAVFALVMGALAILATKHFKEETLKKLLKFTLATVVALAVANLLIMIIKTPVGRMRFRAINSTLGAGMIDNKEVVGFTRWYVSNGKPGDDILKKFLVTYGVKDAFKSFPSGHTCSAGTVYALIMIPTLFDFKSKNKKGATVACWTVPIIYTALVAISRIMVGAHYMSDVTFGGTLAFVCMILSWEIFICKGSHFFAVFPKLKKQKAAVAQVEAVQEAAEETALEDADMNMIDVTEDSETAIEAMDDIAQEDLTDDIAIPPDIDE